MESSVSSGRKEEILLFFYAKTQISVILSNTVKFESGGSKMALLNITKENFQKEVMESNKTVLLDFWATWCGPCMMIAPFIEEIAQERTDITVGKINVDEQMELAMQFSVASIPTLIVIKDGKVVNQSLGARPKEEILTLLGE